MKYTDAFINAQHSTHDRTSCSDENRSNADATGYGCWRCNALEFQSLEKFREAEKAQVKTKKGPRQ